MKSKLAIGIIGGMLLISIDAYSLNAQTKNFGTNRQPRACPSPRSVPTKGRISAAQATIYAACSYESNFATSGTVRFIDILSLEVAKKPRSVNGQDLSAFAQVDVSQPAYDIRGSVVGYTCYNLNGIIYKPGQNCRISRNPQAGGACVKTTFGEWSCSISAYTQTTEEKMPPPP